MNFPSNNQRYVQLDVVAVKVVGEVERTIGFEPVWKGKKPNWTEPKLIGLNRFSIRFGSKTWKKIILVWLFILVQNRTEPKMLSPNWYAIVYISLHNRRFHSRITFVNNGKRTKASKLHQDSPPPKLYQVIMSFYISDAYITAIETFGESKQIYSK